MSAGKNVAGRSPNSGTKRKIDGNNVEPQHFRGMDRKWGFAGTAYSSRLEVIYIVTYIVILYTSLDISMISLLRASAVDPTRCILKI